jgi:hypothetical protein
MRRAMELLEKSKQIKEEGSLGRAPKMGARDINTPVGGNLNPIGYRPPSGTRKSQTSKV